MVHIVFNLSYIYLNSDKVRDKQKSVKVCFGGELMNKNHVLDSMPTTRIACAQGEVRAGDPQLPHDVQNLHT
jgi:hypothetical protein